MVKLLCYLVFCSPPQILSVVPIIVADFFVNSDGLRCKESKSGFPVDYDLPHFSIGFRLWTVIYQMTYVECRGRFCCIDSGKKGVHLMNIYSIWMIALTISSHKTLSRLSICAYMNTYIRIWYRLFDILWSIIKWYRRYHESENKTWIL